MNHLAHALLSGSDADVLLGGVLGDFCRGTPDPSWPPRVRAGVVLHRRIDAYTDGHPAVAAARARFAPPWRRYAGILIDLYFDHALARDWPRHGEEPLAAFSRRVADLLARHEAWLPAGLNRFAAYFRAHGLFGAYAQPAMIERVLAGIGTRLRHANALADAGPALWAQADGLDAAFAQFFPQLAAGARCWRDELIEATEAGSAAAEARLGGRAGRDETG